MELIEKHVSGSNYHARTWDREDAYRYIFRFGKNVIEAGFFVHYADNEIVKRVVELSSSYGCPVGCLHCASGAIQNYSRLSPDEIVEMFNYLVSDNKVEKTDRVLVTFSGIGEGALQSKQILSSSKTIFADYSGAYFNFSTVGYNPKFLKFCDSAAQEIPLNYIQLTYLHFDKAELASIIPTGYLNAYDFDSLVETIKSTSSRVRFNFVMFEGFNDTREHWVNLEKNISPIKEKIVLRISRLNETEYSLKNGLKKPEIETLNTAHKYFEKCGYETHVFTPETNNNMNCGQLVWNYK